MKRLENIDDVHNELSNKVVATPPSERLAPPGPIQCTPAVRVPWHWASLVQNMLILKHKEACANHSWDNRALVAAGTIEGGRHTSRPWLSSIMGR